MYYVNKKELTAFPFDLLYQTVTDAAATVKQGLLDEALALHERATERKIQALYANREESYEGNAEEDFPFTPPDEDYLLDQIRSAKEAAFTNFAEKYDIQGNAGWLLPQYVAYLAKMPITRLESGRIDSEAYFQAFGKDDFHKGLYTLGMYRTRGTIVPKQYTPEYRNYSALVPLLLMPHKKFNGLSYSNWDPEYLRRVVDPQLYEAMTCGLDASEYSKSELLNTRNNCMIVKTGKTAGSSRNPMTTHKMYGLTAPLNQLPWLAQVMLFQIWAAHPSNRTELMVLDWNNWDSMPEPLIDTKVLKVEAPKKTFQFKKATVDDWA